MTKRRTKELERTNVLGLFGSIFFITHPSSLIMHYLKYPNRLAPSLTCYHLIFFTLFMGFIPVTWCIFFFFPILKLIVNLFLLKKKKKKKSPTTISCHHPRHFHKCKSKKDDQFTTQHNTKNLENSIKIKNHRNPINPENHSNP